ncbi:MAG: (2Fe-2S) ferredoxin domain-containing protein [Gemmataceae bacterium]|nr:(2Fe-2S) ferredoxin domain-containing protein [Gemmataceae bacterium]
MSSVHDELQAAVAKRGIGGYERHVFLCTGPSCCTPEDGLAAWEALKQSLKETDLGNACYRTKVGCLRICCHGPTMVVYPEGTWYHGMSADRMPRLVQEHLVEGKPVREWIFADNALAKDTTAESKEPQCG